MCASFIGLFKERTLVLCTTDNGLMGTSMMKLFLYAHANRWTNGVGRQQAQFLAACVFGLKGISPSDELARWS